MKAHWPLSRRRVLALLGVYSAAGLTSYVLWIFFSYLFVPMGPADVIPVPQWNRGGYFTYRPGTYENLRRGVTYTINRHGFRGPDLGMSRRLLKFSGGSVDDYATFSAAVTSPSC